MPGAALPATEVARRKGLAVAQYLMSGRLAHGLELLVQVLSGYGMSLPRTPARAIAKVVRGGARLGIRGLELADRQPEPELRERFTAGSSASRGPIA